MVHGGTPFTMNAAKPWGVGSPLGSENVTCIYIVARARRGSRREMDPFWTLLGPISDPIWDQYPQGVTTPEMVRRPLPCKTHHHELRQ